jgi:hypothetical protein
MTAPQLSKRAWACILRGRRGRYRNACSRGTQRLIGSRSMRTAGAGASARLLQRRCRQTAPGDVGRVAARALGPAPAALIAAPMHRRTARTGRGTSPAGFRGTEQQRGTAGRTSRTMSVATGNPVAGAPSRTTARRGAEATARSRGQPGFPGRGRPVGADSGLFPRGTGQLDPASDDSAQPVGVQGGKADR